VVVPTAYNNLLFHGSAVFRLQSAAIPAGECRSQRAIPRRRRYRREAKRVLCENFAVDAAAIRDAFAMRSRMLSEEKLRRTVQAVDIDGCSRVSNRR